VARKTSDGVKWYQIPAELYDSLQAIQPSRLKFTADLLFGAPARAFRLGTTGLRAGFALVTNPARDFQTFLIQSATDSSPFQRVTAYFQSMRDIVAGGLAGRKSPYLDAFNSLGIQAGNFLGGDVGHAKRAAKGLFHGVLIRRVSSPVESLRELLSFTESVPRLAELRLTAKDLAWKPGTPLTPEQAIALTVAAKRVTTDFTASGDVGRALSQAVPFFNASIQGARAFARTWRERPLQAVLYGLSMFTLPALYTWWSNKDEEWYNALPSRERYLFWNVPDGRGRVIQIPRSLEWQNLFAVIPEALLDSAYRQDPQAIKDAFGHLFASQNPVDYPVLARVLKEQLENRIEFWDRPIVPRAQQDLPPGEQVSPYSSWMARKLGEAFPDTVSPRRIDAALKAYFGGAVPDLIDSLEKIAGVKGFRGVKEAADVPVVGKLFRRGGEFSAASKPLSDFYDHYFHWVKRSKSEARPITDVQKEHFKALSKTYREIRTMTKLAEQQTDPVAQRRLYRSITQKAREELDSARKGRRLAEQED